jgi:hypothetical protein
MVSTVCILCQPILQTFKRFNRHSVSVHSSTSGSFTSCLISDDVRSWSVWGYETHYGCHHIIAGSHCYILVYTEKVLSTTHLSKTAEHYRGLYFQISRKQKANHWRWKLTWWPSGLWLSPTDGYQRFGGTYYLLFRAEVYQYQQHSLFNITCSSAA